MSLYHSAPGSKRSFMFFFSYSPRWHRSPAFMRNKTPFFFVCFCFCCRRCFGCCLTCMCACLVKQCISFRDGTGNLFFFFAGSRLSRLSFLRPFLAVSCINDSVKHFFFFFFADGTFWFNLEKKKKKEFFFFHLWKAQRGLFFFFF